VEKVEKTIKVNEETYKRINYLVGLLREKEKKPVSMNDALLKFLSEVREVKPKLSDFAGSWKMSDAEAKKLKKEIRDLWKTWKI
jgi:predicted CopG family antitoxin